MSHVTCHVKCLCWSLGHAEQRLFSCLGSKVAVYSRKLQCFFDILTLSPDIRVHRAGSQLKNVWTSDKSWEPGSFLMFSYVFQCFLTFSNVTYSHSHSHTLSISHSITLDMLNKFCFHLYAQKSLFIGENCNAFFWTSSSSSASAPCDTWVHRAGSQLKTNRSNWFWIGQGESYGGLW